MGTRVTILSSGTVTPPVVSDTAFYELQKTIDPAFMSSYQITLPHTPTANSMLVMWNGLDLTKNTDFTLSGNIITFVNTIEFALTETIVIKYAYTT